MSNGKGDKQRPRKVDHKTLTDNWRKAFSQSKPSNKKAK